MSQSRHAARKRALDVLYEADVRERPVAEVLAAHRASDEPVAPFSVELVEGVAHERASLDALIETHARSWKLSRMPIVDRNVLRIGAWEILHSDVPVAVAIDEAVELVKELSTDDSGRFVNGVLAKVALLRTAGNS